MQGTKRLLLGLPLAAVLSFAGPPANSGHSSSGGGSSYAGPAPVHGHSTFTGPISGPPPLGAAGPPPLNAAGSLRFGSVPARQNFGFQNSNGHGEVNHVPVNRHSNRNRYGVIGVPYFAPFYGYDSGYYDSASDDIAPGPADNGPDPATQQMIMNQDALGQQVQQLTSEIHDLKAQQQQQGAVPPYLQPNGGDANATSQAAARPPEADAQNDVPVTLVLRSGKQLSVKNYAVTDGTFWDFSRQPAQKIPLSAIDLAASEKATAADGGEFPPLTQ